ncbi:DUF4259 domain-containing protein [Bradyrhizobium diazoefficiens]|uniref:DUF4259 domain-containing protein n=1 Tax=Bradyrhizobium diazoefficiens TaxID=1355477 RepID=UPI00190A2B07|nr:DUF4259 domain-containing protein [Bradyrhizobium diazoefficiens]QQO32267.1 DUF4259 domain-containing protein [Bradyrhizobium diazoefficiens]
MARPKWLSGFAVPIAFCAVILCSDPASAGGWAADTLANDDASDLLGQIVPNGSVELIRSALDAALTPVSPVNDERASRALAAAEMVAAMMGSPSRYLPAPCKEWAALHSKDANRDLIQLAVRTVDRVVKDSGTQELMQEGGAKNLQDWQMSVTNLKARLISR